MWFVALIGCAGKSSPSTVCTESMPLATEYWIKKVHTLPNVVIIVRYVPLALWLSPSPCVSPLIHRTHVRPRSSLLIAAMILPGIPEESGK
jgi:hypothetical protein